MEEKNRDEIIQRVENVAESIEDQYERLKNYTSEYGLCSNCQHFRLIRTQHGSDFTDCTMIYFDDKTFKPIKNDPVKKCTRFWHREWIKMDDLKKMDWIEINPHKRKTGFK